ncbi:MAG: ATP-dependent metallopeptidase FtsH/Yme1/Tma family protein, partial [Duncaniella sp.]|nr:ATP-dependent metallopeptidase FtsH/Yme1/Tma family protein [Duncaniella sp.]
MMSTPDNRPKKGGIRFSMYWAYAIIIVFLVGMLYIDDNSLTKDVSYSKFEQYVASGGVEKITVFTNTNKAEAVVSDSLARTIFHDSQYKPDGGVGAHIVPDIP